MYNHVNDVGGIALDVGFSFPAELAAIIKEKILRLNDRLTGHRYLKGVNALGGVAVGFDEAKQAFMAERLGEISADFNQLVEILNSSVSFMDRVDNTGVLRHKTAEDLGIVGIAGRASGIPLDLREHFSDIYQEVKFKPATQQSGDVLARLRVRVLEFEESLRLIKEFAARLVPGERIRSYEPLKAGEALGYTEAWRGPLLYWVKTDAAGRVERCKIVDPSFHNWQGLAFAVLGNIIPDFPLCNKSFDLSYSGNDL